MVSRWQKRKHDYFTHHFIMGLLITLQNFIQKKNGSDGCAMFFNVHKFRKYNYQYIYMSDHYANFDYDKLKAIVDKNDFDKLKQLPQVAQFLCLKPKNNNVAENDEITNKMVLASNTHLTYLPNLENLRDLQCDIILKHAFRNSISHLV